ncbi:MAG: GNAT family N-acetyltransferase [Verrucomicrobiaceae bacterium]|nr:MAG: GNAT family N-acetyltransferase [Verrucomicrobiaceae bacterium]
MNSVSSSTTTGIAVREAVAEDALQIAGLLGALGYPSTETLVRDRLAHLSVRAEDAVFVADYAGELAGFLSFHISPLFHAEGCLGRITALAVSTRFQRSGIGRQLVAAAEQFAWTHGCVRIEVTSGDHRLDAHAFYEAVGFRMDIRRFIKSQP